MSQASPSPKLNLPPDFRGEAFRIIEDVLRTFPILATTVTTWRSREGNGNDTQLRSNDQAPIISLSPINNPNTIFGVDETRINFAVLVELYVAGSCVEDITRLWWQVEEAIRIDRVYKGKPLQQYLCDTLHLPPQDPAGEPPNKSYRSIVNLRPLTPAFFPLRLDRPDKNNTDEYQTGEGALVCYVARPR